MKCNFCRIGISENLILSLHIAVVQLDVEFLLKIACPQNHEKLRAFISSAAVEKLESALIHVLQMCPNYYC